MVKNNSNRRWAIFWVLIVCLSGLFLFNQEGDPAVTVSGGNSPPSEAPTRTAIKVLAAASDTARREVEKSKEGAYLRIIDAVTKEPIGTANVYLFSLPEMRQPSRELSTNPNGELRLQEDLRIEGWSVQKKGYYSKAWIGVPQPGIYELEPAKLVIVRILHQENALLKGLTLQANISFDFSREKEDRRTILGASMERSKKSSLPLLVGNEYRVLPPRHDGMHFIVSARGSDYSYPFGLVVFEKGVYEYDIEVPAFDIGPDTGSLRISIRLPLDFASRVYFRLKSKHGNHPVDPAFAPQRVAAGTGLYSAYVPSLPEGEYRFEILFMKEAYTYRSNSIQVKGEAVYEGRIEGETIELTCSVPEAYKGKLTQTPVVLAFGLGTSILSRTTIGSDGVRRLFVPKATRYLFGAAGSRIIGTRVIPIRNGNVPLRIAFEPLFRVRLGFDPEGSNMELLDVHDLDVDFQFPKWVARNRQTGRRRISLVAGSYRISRKGGAWIDLKLPRDANKTIQVPGPKR